MTNQFLFRETYSLKEKIRRIPPSIITAETPEIRSRISSTDITDEDVDRLGKHDLFDESEEELDPADYLSFIDEIFEEYGTKGDKFNMQLFRTDQSIPRDTLDQQAERYIDNRLDNIFDFLSEPIVLTDYRTNGDSVDLQFRTSARREDISPDENIPVQIIEDESGDVVEDYGPDYTVRAPARYHIEARAYPRLGFVAISNYSKINDGLQTDIAKTVLGLARMGRDNRGRIKRLELNETELLLLLQEMEGDVSGLGYSLEVAGVDTADFSGQRDEDMVDTHVVRAADEAGQIRKIKFYVDYLGEGESERAVMLRIFDDGHLTTSKPVRTELLDAIVEEIDIIREYEGFTVPLTELIYSYVGGKFRGRPSTMRNSHISKTNIAFNNLIEVYFDEDGTPSGEQRLYKSMIANIGIRLCNKGVPESDEFEDVIPTDDFYDYEGKLGEFFKDYSRRELQLDDIDYEELTNHLNHLLHQNWDSPVDIIEYAIDKYDLSR